MLFVILSMENGKNLKSDKINNKSDKLFMLCKLLRYGKMILMKGAFFMTNEEYIKSLEARITLLEKAIENLTSIIALPTLFLLVAKIYSIFQAF